VREERLKHVADIQVSNVDKKTTEGDQPVRLCNYTDVYYNEHITGELDFMMATATPDQRVTFGLTPDDVLLTKDSETADDIGVSALVTEDIPDLVCGYHLAVVRPHRGRALGGYLRWVLASLLARQRMSALATGVTRFGLRSEAIADMPIPVPTLAIQEAIADYLDNETARIDALIVAKRRMIELLEERDITLMHEFTSRGLRKSSTVDTQVHWLGGIPAHWQAMQIRRVGYVRRGASPRPIDDPIYFDDDGEYAWVRIADVTHSGRYLTETTQRLSPLGSSLSAKLAVGSLFISIAGSVGKPIIAKIKCCVHDGFVYFERLRVRPDYLYYLFRASQLFQGLGKFGTQLNLNTETVGGIVIPVPPLDEQDEIVAELDRRLDLANELQSANLRHIELLRERRAALITNAVTGQLDIPEAA
jgi:type I restriction enzyme, S subunit